MIDTPKNPLTLNAISLLQALIRTTSFSKEEAGTADIIASFFLQEGYRPQRIGNNVWVRAHQWREGRPLCLLNSHHDTVRPNAGYTRDPFEPTIEGDRLYGLGSNDAGGALVALISAFLELDRSGKAPVNLLIAATAEEEISGPNGVAATLPELGPIDYGIVGEPTSLRLATAERGLIVIDGETEGVAGHAAREEGRNALYLAIEDIQRLRAVSFARASELLGPVKVSITQIEAGTQHNVVPDRCQFVLDVRVNECYSNEAVVAALQRNVHHSQLKPRSLRLQSSGIPHDHPLVESGLRLGLETYGSPTLSDQALMSFPTLKLGPGKSARSHTADEFILLSEIEAGIHTYVALIEGIQTTLHEG